MALSPREIISDRSMTQYVREAMDNFDTRAFCTLDALVLTELSYYRFECFDVVPETFRKNAPTLVDVYRAECFEEYFKGQHSPQDDYELLEAVAASPRFRTVKLTKHVADTDLVKEKQFSATTFLLPDKTVFVAFRGTDGDLIGWKEDFNLALPRPVPAQKSALQYLNQVGARTSGVLRVGGHSKGGNLAVYATVFAKPEVQKRIKTCYSFDGPGFDKSVVPADKVAPVKDRIEKIVPEGSIIGLLLQQESECTIVQSKSFGLEQHCPFNWQTTGNEFRPADKLQAPSTYVCNTLNSWSQTQTAEQWQNFVDVFFKLLEASGKRELSAIGPKELAESMKALAELDPDTRKIVTDCMMELAGASLKTLAPDKDGKK